MKSNYRHISCLFLLFSLFLICHSQTRFEQFDEKIRRYISAGQFYDASDAMIQYAWSLDSVGDKEAALDYQLMNCNLVEKHLDYFFDHGMTLQEYFSNREIVSIMYRDLGQTSNAIQTYLSIINDMMAVSPEMIPFYSNLMAPTLGSCKDPYLCDSVYSLSHALDIIRANPSDKQSVKDFVRMSQYFNHNRFYNNKMDECDAWFDRYVGFINKLDSTIYKDEIIEFYLNYIDIVYIRASNATAREADYYKAISLLEKAITLLESIKAYDNQLELRIASYYSIIGGNYFHLKNDIKSKEYNEKALSFLVNYSGIKNLQFCEMLSNIALNFWNLHQPEVASSLKKAEIETRKTTLMEPSISDYAVLMMYNSFNAVENLEIGQEVINMYGDTCCSSMSTIYKYIADANSSLMVTCPRGSKEFEQYKSSYIQYIDKAEQMFERNISYEKKHSFYEKTLAGLHASKATHFLRLNENDSAFTYSEKAYLIDNNDERLYLVCLSASQGHNLKALRKYLPLYYNHIERDLKKMLPMLGTVESESYLQQGYHPLYQIIGWVSNNPQDSLCSSIAYNSALLLKNLYLNSSSLMPYISDDDLLGDYLSLSSLKDSIITDMDLQSRTSALIEYEIRERRIRSHVLDEIIPKIFAKWTDVQQALDADEVALEIIEYITNIVSDTNEDKRYAALIIDRHHAYPVIIDLFGVNDIKEVYNNQPKSYANELGYGLYNKLWNRLMPYIQNASKVYFSPMGLISMIGVENLTDSSGIPAGEKLPLIRLSSTKQIAYNQDNKIDNIALFGGIDYSTNNEYYTFTLDSLNTRGNWSYLAETLNEVNGVEELFSKKGQTISLHKYVGSNATERQFKDVCSTHPNVIHIASHGFYVPEDKRNSVPYYRIDDSFSLKDNLFYSGLVFAGGQDTWNSSLFETEANDGILSSYEISKMDFRNTDLIVLSACETGIGDMSYDGILGLQRGFKIAGAHSIMMSLWKVDDAATALFMNSFYETYLNTKSKHEAMMAAQRTVRLNYPDPYFWAAFILLD